MQETSVNATTRSFEFCLEKNMIIRKCKHPGKDVMWYINHLARESTSNVTDSDLYRRQILISKFDLRTEKLNYS